jgi:hypothetical protein
MVIQQPTKDITFQAIIYHRRHDTICTYKKHSMYLSGSQVRREKTGRHAPSMKEGPTMEEEKERASIVDRNEERLSDERKKVPLDEMKKVVHPYGKRGGPTLLLLEPTLDQVLMPLTSTTNGATRYNELAGGVRSMHQKVENPNSA